MFFVQFRLKSIKQHLEMGEHLRLASAESQQQSKVLAGIQLAEARRREAVITALQTAYHVITEELLNVKYTSTMHFLRFMNLQSARYLNQGENASYDSSTIFIDLLGCLSKVSENVMKAQLHASKFTGLGIDESTDRVQHKHAALVV